jgi:RNA polymerase sigma factor for flagellar operon FliA
MNGSGGSRRRDDLGRDGLSEEERLVREHLPLVQYAVSDLAARIPPSVSRSDLVSAGLAGLAQAARSFDPARGVAFDRYASRRIQGALLDELRSLDWASRLVRSNARAMRNAVDQVTGREGRTPTTAEVAAEMKVSERTVHEIEANVHRSTVLNFESLIQGADPGMFVSTTGPSAEDVMLERERLAYLDDAIEALPERLRRVVKALYFEDCPISVLAAEFGVVESRISQLRAAALRLLRAGIQSQLDPEALPEEARPNGRAARDRAAYFEAIADRTQYRDRLEARITV